MIVRLREDDERMGLKAGDVLACIPYRFDPNLKLTVVRRVSDGFDPMCNVYRSDVEIVEDPETPPKKTRARTRKST